MRDDIARCLRQIEAFAGDPRGGLPPDVFLFVSRLTPLVNVDLLIRDPQGRILLTWRDDEFFGTGWHVPGGIIRLKETAAERVRTCAREELGAEVECDDGPVHVSEDIRTDATRGHHVALLFECRLATAPDERRHAVNDPPAAGQWRWHERCPVDLIPAQAHYARYFHT